MLSDFRALTDSLFTKNLIMSEMDVTVTVNGDPDHLTITGNIIEGSVVLNVNRCKYYANPTAPQPLYKRITPT